MAFNPNYKPVGTRVVYPTAGTNVVVVHQQQQRRGLLGEIGAGLKQLGREVDRAAVGAWKTVDPQGYSLHQSIQTLLTTGNVVQLISRVSGRSLQCVSLADGKITLNAKGPEGPQQENWFSHFTVFRETGNVVKLHNGPNFVAIAGGSVTLLHFPPNSQPSGETRLRFTESGQFITLQSLSNVGKYIGVNPDGSFKSIYASGNDQSAHFGIRLVYSPHGITQP